MEMQIIGAIKIKDGVFIGDEFAAKDLEFIITNKVTHIINCAGKQIPNVWESIGVQYLTFPWQESDNQILFDQKDENLNEIFNFIEECQVFGESCLVHSVRGQSRSCCVLAAYFMKKYRWTLYKTLEYLNSRRPDLEIRACFFHQLTLLESKLARQGEGAKSATWSELGEDPNNIEGEELLLRNTFLNSRNQPIADIFMANANNEELLQKNGAERINWSDDNTNDTSKLLSMVIPYEDFIKPSKIISTRTYIKSILKGSKKVQKIIGNHNEGSSSTTNLHTLSGKKSGVVFQPQLKSNKSAKNLMEDNHLAANHMAILNQAQNQNNQVNVQPQTQQQQQQNQSIPISQLSISSQINNLANKNQNKISNTLTVHQQAAINNNINNMQNQQKVNGTTPQQLQQGTKPQQYAQTNSILRSSSLTQFDKENNDNANNISSTSETNTLEQKINNMNNNLKNVAINNFLSPGNLQNQQLQNMCKQQQQLGNNCQMAQISSTNIYNNNQQLKQISQNQQTDQQNSMVNNLLKIDINLKSNNFGKQSQLVQNGVATQLSQNSQNQNIMKNSQVESEDDNQQNKNAQSLYNNVSINLQGNSQNLRSSSVPKRFEEFNTQNNDQNQNQGGHHQQLRPSSVQHKDKKDILNTPAAPTQSLMSKLKSADINIFNENKIQSSKKTEQQPHQQKSSQLANQFSSSGKKNGNESTYNKTLNKKFTNSMKTKNNENVLQDSCNSLQSQLISLQNNFLNVLNQHQQPGKKINNCANQCQTQQQNQQQMINQNEINNGQGTKQNSSNIPLKAQDNNILMNNSINQQVNQINQISSSLMKSIMNFQPQSSSHKSQNGGNNSSFLLGNNKNAPIRATGDIIDKQSPTANNFIQSKLQSYEQQQQSINGKPPLQQNNFINTNNVSSSVSGNIKEQLRPSSSQSQQQNNIGSNNICGNNNNRSGTALRSFSPCVKNQNSNKQDNSSKLQSNSRQRLRSSSPGQSSLNNSYNNNSSNANNTNNNKDNFQNNANNNNIFTYNSLLLGQTVSANKPRWKFQ